MRIGVIILVLAVAAGVAVLFLKERFPSKPEATSSDFPPQLLARVNEAREDRERVRSQDPKFFESVSNAMFAHDPIGINFKTNTDEYDAEAGTVIPRLKTCTSVDDVATVLHQEFVKWFGASTAGDRERYIELARDIWTLHKQRG